MPKLISDLAVMLLTAGIVTILFRRLGQPLVLGYILAGFLVGPYMPFFFTVADSASIETWSEIGIIVLMFGLGLEFNLHKLASVGGTAVITALTEVLGMLVLGYLVGQAMGWPMMDSIFLGGMLSMSSTTIIIKAFDELGVRKQPFAELVFGTLVIEDIAGIFMMIILSTVSVSKNISGAALALQLGELVLYLALWLILGIYILPTFLQKARDFMNDETLLIVSLGICFGMVLLAEALGFSSALGAFLAGSLLAGTVHAERVEHLTGGIKDLFGTVFFLSVGMMIDPAMIVRYALPILIVTLVTVFGKLIISSLGVLLSGQPLRIAVHCGASLAQIGEFAFIIATLGMNLGVISDYLYPIIVSVSVITTLTTPAFIKNADRLYLLVRRLLPKRLGEKLERYTSDTPPASETQDSDWANYLRRYVRITVLYGVLMFGATLIGQLLVYPFLQDNLPDARIAQAVSILFCALGISLFIRPMLDLHSTEYTTLWVKNRYYRLPLIALTALRFMLIVLIAFTVFVVLNARESLTFNGAAGEFVHRGFSGTETFSLSDITEIRTQKTERGHYRMGRYRGRDAIPTTSDRIIFKANGRTYSYTFREYQYLYTEKVGYIYEDLDKLVRLLLLYEHYFLNPPPADPNAGYYQERQYPQAANFPQEPQMPQYPAYPQYPQAPPDDPDNGGMPEL